MSRRVDISIFWVWPHADPLVFETIKASFDRTSRIQ